MADCCVVLDQSDGNNTHRDSQYNPIHLLFALLLGQLCDCCQTNDRLVFVQLYYMNIHFVPPPPSMHTPTYIS
jgi:hypothetical protein